MIQTGTLLQNRYRVAEQIGKGGMGEVYVATDERFQSTVAIKRTFYEDPEMRRAFGREAQLLNRLRHAALPKVSDHFSEGGDHFLVMEFVEGSDLSEIMKQRKVPFPLADVLRWADELLDALEYLHTQEPSVVHRDIKPQNIKLTKRGSVVLLDFGLAKVMPGQTDAGTASSVFGYSMNFAPLEQMQGTGTDPRSDLYSLAATLYFLLTGVRPADALTRASATVKQEPDPLRPAHLLQPQVPAAVSHVLTRAMSQNAVRRHASAAEMRSALRQAAGGAARPEARPALSAASVMQQDEKSYHEVTLVESSLQAHGTGLQASQARPQTFNPSQTLPPPAPRGGEAAAFADSRRQPRISDSLTAIAPASSSREGSSAKKSLALLASFLVVCALAGTYLFTRASGSHAPSAETNAGAQSPAPQYNQAAPATQTPNATSAPVSDSTHAATDTNAPAQSAPSHPAGDAPGSNSQTASQAAETPNRTDAQAGSAANGNPNGVAAGGSSGGRPALVIQNPASAVSTAEEPRRDQPSSQPQNTDRPPPGAYPPPPDDRRPPPPDGRRPPPNFRPPPP